jgi:hypothetical protein
MKNENSESALQIRAEEIHQLVPKRTQDKTTIAVTRAIKPDGGTVYVVSSSERRLRPDQRKALKENEIAAHGPGHAEVTGVNCTIEQGWIPQAIAASRPICSHCKEFLSKKNVSPESPLKSQ